MIDSKEINQHTPMMQQTVIFNYNLLDLLRKFYKNAYSLEMSYESLQSLSAAAFRRSVGIDRALFHELVNVLAQAEQQKKKSGRPSLSLENQLCLALSDWREYRTFFHLGLSFGVHESNAQRITCRVEERLAASGYLDLVKRSASAAKAVEKEVPVTVEPVVVLLDASEVPIERPKKAKRASTVVKSTRIP